MAQVTGQLLPIPINLDTVNKLYGYNFSSEELADYFANIGEKVDTIRTSEDVVVSQVGRDLYEKFFRGYTRKQWGLDPSELDKSVTSRIPVRTNRDDRYFTDEYQYMPLHGYTRMFENMLDNRNINILLNTDFKDIEGFIPYKELIFTGPIDEYFDYCYGKLPYRSLHFQHVTLNEEWHQPVGVVNYPNDQAYTRVTEYKYLTGQRSDKTSITFEFPSAEGDPYYPIPKPENAELYRKYQTLAEEVPHVHFAGRLGTYRYYNMDQVVAQALTLYKKLALRTSATEAIKRTNGQRKKLYSAG